MEDDFMGGGIEDLDLHEGSENEEEEEEEEDNTVDAKKHRIERLDRARNDRAAEEMTSKLPSEKRLDNYLDITDVEMESFEDFQSDTVLITSKLLERLLGRMGVRDKERVYQYVREEVLKAGGVVELGSEELERMEKEEEEKKRIAEEERREQELLKRKEQEKQKAEQEAAKKGKKPTLAKGKKDNYLDELGDEDECYEEDEDDYYDDEGEYDRYVI
jgi:hypothetical protein